MSAFIAFNEGTQHGRLFRDALRAMERADDLLSAVRGVMVQMLEGDGSADAHYAEIQSRFGFDSTAKARAAFAELDSCYAKTSGNGSVSNVRAARDQVFEIFRG